jgi:hypothetical protein
VKHFRDVARKFRIQMACGRKHRIRKRLPPGPPTKPGFETPIIRRSLGRRELHRGGPTASDAFGNDARHEKALLLLPVSTLRHAHISKTD